MGRFSSCTVKKSQPFDCGLIYQTNYLKNSQVHHLALGLSKLPHISLKHFGLTNFFPCFQLVFAFFLALCMLLLSNISRASSIYFSLFHISSCQLTNLFTMPTHLGLCGLHSWPWFMAFVALVNYLIWPLSECKSERELFRNDLKAFGIFCRLCFFYLFSSPL